MTGMAGMHGPRTAGANSRTKTGHYGADKKRKRTDRELTHFAKAPVGPELAPPIPAPAIETPFKAKTEAVPAAVSVKTESPPSQVG